MPQSKVDTILTNITGITIGDNETKLLAYADDMTALLSDIREFKI